MNLKTIIIILAMLANFACSIQTSQNMSNNNNPLLCDTETGMCEIPTTSANVEKTEASLPKAQKLRVLYFTDPICSSCWGIEPQIRKLKLEYGAYIEIEYRMGGLLPDWSYNSGGISKPSDVANHWDEVSHHYDMPIDGDLWLEDPLHSSYPPSIAFKAAQMQDKEKAILFLREIREMVFLRKKNITKWEHIVLATQKVGLDVEQLKADFQGEAKKLFEEDLQLAKQFGVRGFPTMFFIDSQGNQELVYGSRPYAFYETSILKLSPSIIKKEYYRNWEALFAKYSSLTAKEFAELSGSPRIEGENLLQALSEDGKLSHFSTKNGSIYSLVSN